MTPVVSPEKTIDLAHPGRVALGKVVVDCDDVDAAAGDGIEINRQGGDQGFSLASLHFRNAAFVKDDSADHLHIKMAQAEGAFRGFPDCGKSRGKKLVEGAAGGKLFLEPCRAGAKVGIAQTRQFVFQGIDFSHPALEFGHHPVIAGAENLPRNGAQS